jgi:hypothetical protein
MATIRTRCVAAVLFTLPLCAMAIAQDAGPPDLSGTWTLDLTKSKTAKHSIQRGQTLGVEYTPDYTTTTYDIGGKVTPIAHVRGGQVLGKAYWKKSALIIETFGTPSGPGSNPATSSPRMPESSGPDPATGGHTIQRLSLSTDGKTLTREFGNGKEAFVYEQEEP